MYVVSVSVSPDFYNTAMEKEKLSKFSPQLEYKAITDTISVKVCVQKHL